MGGGLTAKTRGKQVRERCTGRGSLCRGRERGSQRGSAVQCSYCQPQDRGRGALGLSAYIHIPMTATSVTPEKEN